MKELCMNIYSILFRISQDWEGPACLYKTTNNEMEGASDTPNNVGKSKKQCFEQ